MMIMIKKRIQDLPTYLEHRLSDIIDNVYVYYT